MDKIEAAKILEQHNKWRRNRDDNVIIPMPDVKELGIALEVAVKALNACICEKGKANERK